MYLYIRTDDFVDKCPKDIKSYIDLKNITIENDINYFIKLLTSPLSSAVTKVSLKLVTDKTPDIPFFDSLTGSNIRTFSALVTTASPGNNFMLYSFNEFLLLEPKF